MRCPESRPDAPVDRRSTGVDDRPDRHRSGDRSPPARAGARPIRGADRIDGRAGSRRPSIELAAGAGAAVVVVAAAVAIVRSARPRRRCGLGRRSTRCRCSPRVGRSRQRVRPVPPPPAAAAAAAAGGDADRGRATTGTAAAADLIVQAAGAVVRPGRATELADGSPGRRPDRRAGGLAADADADRVNLAAPLARRRAGLRAAPGRGRCARRGRRGSAGRGGGAGRRWRRHRAGDAWPTRSTSTPPTPRQLDALPGVGPATAAAIIDHRTAQRSVPLGRRPRTRCAGIGDGQAGPAPRPGAGVMTRRRRRSDGRERSPATVVPGASAPLAVRRVGRPVPLPVASRGGRSRRGSRRPRALVGARRRRRWPRWPRRWPRRRGPASDRPRHGRRRPSPPSSPIPAPRRGRCAPRCALDGTASSCGRAGGHGAVLRGRARRRARSHVDGRAAPRPDRRRLVCRARHIVGRIEVRVGCEARRATATPASGWPTGLRRTARRRCRVARRPDQRALFTGFVLGDDRGQSAEVADDFRAPGSRHLLVVSGRERGVRAGAWPARSCAGSACVAAGSRHAGRRSALFGVMTRFEPSVLRAIGDGGHRRRRLRCSAGRCRASASWPWR